MRCNLGNELLDRDDSVNSDLANLKGVLVVHCHYVSLHLTALPELAACIVGLGALLFLRYDVFLQSLPFDHHLHAFNCLLLFQFLDHFL